MLQDVVKMMEILDQRGDHSLASISEVFGRNEIDDATLAWTRQAISSALSGGPPPATATGKKGKKSGTTHDDPAAAIEQITKEVFTDEKGALELLRALRPMEGVDVEVQRVDENADDDSDWVDSAGDDEDADLRSMEVHEDDLLQINSMIGKLGPLSQETLEELSQQWNVGFASGGDHLLYRTNITERIRYLAAIIIVGVADRFHCLHNSSLHNGAPSEMLVLVNNLVLSLWHGIGILAPDVRDNIAVIFELEAGASAHEVCTVVTGLGITTFFRSLPVPLLEKVCKELKVTPKQKDKIDPDILHESLTHAVCSYFYPTLSARQNMALRCTVHITIHENGPGSFTCTIDNSWMMALLMRDLFTSNQFTCAKVKWRAQVAVSNGNLSFIVNQRSKSFRVKMSLRNSDGKKKKAKAAKAANGGKPEGLFLEAEMDSTPKNHIGFENVVSLQDLYDNPTTSPNGLRLYNKAEDRVSFQFTLECSPIDASGEPQKKDELEASQGKSKPKQEVKDPAQTAAELLAQEEEEKREKAKAKKAQQFEKRRQALDLEEQKARDKIIASMNGTTSQMNDEISRSYQRALTKAKEREKQELAALMKPNAELQAQQQEAQQIAQRERSAVSKLQQEKNTLDKQLTKLQEKVSSRRAELEQLKKLFESNQAESTSIAAAVKETAQKKEDLAVEVKRRIEAKQERSQKREERRERRERERNERLEAKRSNELRFESSDSTPMAPTAAIKDFQSFWGASKDEGGSPFLSGPSLGGSDPNLGPAAADSYGSPSRANSTSSLGDSMGGMTVRAGNGAPSFGASDFGSLGGPPVSPQGPMGGDYFGGRGPHPGHHHNGPNRQMMPHHGMHHVQMQAPQPKRHHSQMPPQHQHQHQHPHQHQQQQQQQQPQGGFFVQGSSNSAPSDSQPYSMTQNPQNRGMW